MTEPERFTFPFYYEPHPLAILAAEELQQFLLDQKHIEHNFGLDEGKKGLVIGKMFGVLVVRDKGGQLGYLSAFSGKMAESNHHPGFVPPVYDMLEERGFFTKEILVLNELNKQVAELEEGAEYRSAAVNLETLRMEAERNIGLEKKEVKEGKKKRKVVRAAMDPEMNESDAAVVLERLSQESIRANYKLRDVTKKWKDQVNVAEQKHEKLHQKLLAYKQERKARSGALQDKLFRNYTFMNERGETQSLLDLFADSALGRPSAGAGECAAPKLLQFAFLEGLTPIALAEFWWGASPSAEVRKSGNFYPACIGKCKPILTHMLSRTSMDPDPLMSLPGKDLEIETIYEDEFLIVINKPAEFLSVPGRRIKDSAQSRMKAKYPEATGPMIVHRLDMSTSGLMVVAKNLEVYKKLQRQFSSRKVEKRYVAVLEGELSDEGGVVELPLILDYTDRPRQCVSYDRGKDAYTTWEKVGVKDGRTRVHFFPKTGRTHQLRVHAAHQDGLNAPIVGDDLYGCRDKRLHLHAEELTFTHPVTQVRRTFLSKAPF